MTQIDPRTASLASCSMPGAVAPRPGRPEGAARGRGTWALADQATLSLGNFLTSLVLVRYWGNVNAYGRYVFVIYVIWFLNSLHGALVTYPLTLRGAECDPGILGRLAGRSLAMSACASCLLGAGLATLILWMGRPSLLLPAVAAMLFWQAQETTRRALLSKLRHAHALAGDAVSFLGQAAVIWLLIKTRGGPALSVEMVFLVVAATSGAGCLIQAVQLGAAPHGWSALAPAFSDCWRTGRWLLFAALISAGTVYLSPWTLKAAWGDATIAKYSVLSTLLNVTNPVSFTVAGLIVPAVAAARAQGAAHAQRPALHFAGQGALLLAPYFLLLLVAPGLALRTYCGAHSPYGQLTTELRLFVIGYALGYSVIVCTAVLNGLGRTRGTFVVNAAAAVANVAITLPLVIRYGLTGAVWGGMAPMVFQAILAARFLRSAGSTHAAAFAPRAASAPVRAAGA